MSGFPSSSPFYAVKAKHTMSTFSSKRTVVRLPRLLTGRWLVCAGLVQYILSMVFLLTASLLGSDALPRWIGFLDVRLVVTLLTTLALLWFRTGSTPNLYSRAWSYRVAIYVPTVLLLLMWLGSDRLIWSILLPGLAWRMWFLLYSLPIAVSVWSRSTVRN